VNRAKAIESARAVLAGGTDTRADAVALALYVLEVNQSIEGAFSPSAPSVGGGVSPAAPALAPVSKKSDAASSARNLGGPSGPCTRCGIVPKGPQEDCILGAEVPGAGTEPHSFDPKEADTLTEVGRTDTNAATVPTVYPTSGLAWQDEQIAVWLEGHAAGYEHGGLHDIAKAHRKRAMQIRRREYLEKP